MCELRRLVERQEDGQRLADVEFVDAESSDEPFEHLPAMSRQDLCGQSVESPLEHGVQLLIFRPAQRRPIRPLRCLSEQRFIQCQ